jgi:hypothetical protein
MDIFDSNEDKINLTMVAYEVGMATLGKIIDYYNQMLLITVTQLSELSDKTPNEIRIEIETQLGLLGAMDTYLERLQATSDFNKEMLGITDEDVERILDEFPED